MLRIALSTLAARKSGMLGAFAAVALAVVLVVSCGILLDSSLRAPIRVSGSRRAAVVVQAHPTIQPGERRGDGQLLLASGGGCRRPSRRSCATCPASTAVADRSFYARLVDRDGRVVDGPSDGAASVGHGWASAALTPYTLTSGRAPHGARRGRRRRGAGAQRRSTRRSAPRSRPRPARGRFTVAGIAAHRTRRLPSRETAVFFRDDVAARLSGNGDRADLIGVVTEPRRRRAALVADRIREALDRPGLRVLTGAKRGEAESPDDAAQPRGHRRRPDRLRAARSVRRAASSSPARSRSRSSSGTASSRSSARSAARRARCGAWSPARPCSSLAGVRRRAPRSACSPRGSSRACSSAAGMVPEGLHLAIGWLPFARRPRRGDRDDADRRVRQRAPRLPHPSHRRAARGERAATPALTGPRACRTGGRWRAASPSSPHPAGGEDSARRGHDVWMLAAALLGPLLALPFVWLLGLPLAGSAAGPGLLARANTRANLRRVASVATPVMLAVSLVCTFLFAKADAPAAGDEPDRRPHDRGPTYSAPRRRAGLSPAPSPRLPAACQGVARRRERSRRPWSSPPTAPTCARSPLAAWMRLRFTGVVDLGVASGSLTRSARQRARRRHGRRDAIRLASRRPVRLWLGRRHAGHACASRRPTRGPSASASRAAARARRRPRHPSCSTTPCS